MWALAAIPQQLTMRPLALTLGSSLVIPVLRGAKHASMRSGSCSSNRSKMKPRRLA
jgi:hypothetical protein